MAGEKDLSVPTFATISN